MTAVLGIGRLVGPFVDGPVDAAHLWADAASSLPALHVAISDHLEGDSALLVITSDRLGESVASRLEAVCAAMGGPAVLLHRTPLPPLAADVLVTLAGALARPLGGAHHVAAVMPMLERQILTLTWLGSLAGVVEPRPGIKQRARDGLPGASWLVTSWPEPRITAYGDRPLPPLPIPAVEVGVAWSGAGGTADWIVDAVIDELTAVPVEVPSTDDAHAWWGTRRVTEVVVHPRDIDALTGSLAPHLDPGKCPWCRRAVGSTTCPWCGLDRTAEAIGAVR